jgi:hypothetical protein
MQEGFSYQTVTNPNLHRKEFMVADMQKVNKQLALFLERY